MRRDDRWSPVPLQLLYDLPAGSYRLYTLAAAEGRMMTPRRGFESLQPRERPIGVRVSPVQRDRVLVGTGTKLRNWQKAARVWAAAGFAHPCARGRVFLLLQAPADGFCPDCGGPLQYASTRTRGDLLAHSEAPVRAWEGGPSTGIGEGDEVSYLLAELDSSRSRDEAVAIVTVMDECPRVRVTSQEAARELASSGFRADEVSRWLSEPDRWAGTTRDIKAFELVRRAEELRKLFDLESVASSLT